MEGIAHDVSGVALVMTDSGGNLIPAGTDRPQSIRLRAAFPDIIRAYVATMHALRGAARRTGLLAYLDRRRNRWTMLYLRSLLAVRDIEDMAALDLALWPFPAMAAVDAFLKARAEPAAAFEYGSGAGTVWLARRCRRVDFVEHDAAWWSPFAPLLAGLDNVHGRLVPPSRPGSISPPARPSARRSWRGYDFADYVRAIRDAPGPFDLIVIDGRAREHCLAEAVRHLKDDGVVLFDDVARHRYRSAIAASALAERRFRGLVPTAPHASEAALLAPRPGIVPERPGLGKLSSHRM